MEIKIGVNGVIPLDEILGDGIAFFTCPVNVWVAPYNAVKSDTWEVRKSSIYVEIDTFESNNITLTELVNIREHEFISVMDGVKLKGILMVSNVKEVGGATVIKVTSLNTNYDILTDATHIVLSKDILFTAGKTFKIDTNVIETLFIHSDADSTVEMYGEIKGLLGEYKGSGASTSELDPIAMLKINSLVLTEHKNYYVSNTTGDDTNDGLTWGTAKKSLSFLDTDIPKILAYNGELIVNLDETVVVQNANHYIELKGFNGAGRIRIIGKQTIVDTGTISNVNNNYDEFGRYRIIPSFPLEPSALVGLHVRFGAAESKTYPILDNDDTYIYIAPTTYDLSNGDTLDIMQMTRFIGAVNDSALNITDNVISYIEMKNIDLLHNAPNNNNSLVMHNSGEISFKRCSMRSVTANKGDFTYYSTYIKTNYNIIGDSSYYNKCVIDGGDAALIAQKDSSLSMYCCLIANTTGMIFTAYGNNNPSSIGLYDVVGYKNINGFQIAKGSISFNGTNRFIRSGGNTLDLGNVNVSSLTTPNTILSLHPTSNNIDCTYGKGVVSDFSDWWSGGYPQSEEVSFNYWNGTNWETETVAPINAPRIQSCDSGYLINSGINHVTLKGNFFSEIYKVELFNSSDFSVATANNLVKDFNSISFDISHNLPGMHKLKVFSTRGTDDMAIEVKDGILIIPDGGDWVRISSSMATSEGRMEVTTTNSGWNKGASFGTVPANSDFELTLNLFDATGSTGNIMFGADNSDPDWNYNTIDYAFYVYGTSLRVYENGSAKGNVASISPTHLDFMLKRENGVITYHYKDKNDTLWVLLYTSLTESTTSMVFDNSIYRYYGAENIKLMYFN